MENMRGSVPRRVRVETSASSPTPSKAMTTTHCWAIGDVRADGGVMMSYRHPRNTVCSRSGVYVHELNAPDGCKVILRMERDGYGAVSVGEIRQGANRISEEFAVKEWEKFSLSAVTVDANGEAVDASAFLSDVWVTAEFAE